MDRQTVSKSASFAEKPAPSQPEIDPAQLVSSQRAYFESGATLDVNRRILALQRFYDAVRRHEPQLAKAMKEDLGKSGGWLTPQLQLGRGLLLGPKPIRSARCENMKRD